MVGDDGSCTVFRSVWSVIGCPLLCLEYGIAKTLVQSSTKVLGVILGLQLNQQGKGSFEYERDGAKTLASIYCLNSR